jgi:hypothetical protein
MWEKNRSAPYRIKIMPTAQLAAGTQGATETLTSAVVQQHTSPAPPSPE